MIDTKLNRYIKARKMKVGDVARILGISRQAFHRKMLGGIAFTATEALQLKKLLGIAESDMSEIFEK